jgi:hypothetical protein
MPRETVTIELSKLEPYEAAAQLFAVIAYPDSQKDRVRFSDAICGWVLGELAQDDPEWASAPQPTKPRYWLAFAKGTTVEIAKGLRVINRQRVIAAKMAAQRYEEYRLFAMEGREPGWAQRPTSGKVIDAISMDLMHPERRATRGRKGKGTVDGENVTSRVWTPSRPVLHLCLALHQAVHVLSPNQQELNFGDFLTSKTPIAGIIREAAPISIAMRPCFDIKAEERIEVIAA